MPLAKRSRQPVSGVGSLMAFGCAYFAQASTSTRSANRRRRGRKPRTSRDTLADELAQGRAVESLLVAMRRSPPIS